jgi:hypothetical protein
LGTQSDGLGLHTSILKTVAACPSEISVSAYKNTWCRNSDHNLNEYDYELGRIRQELKHRMFRFSGQHSCFIFGNVRFRISDRRAAVLARNFLYFSQSLHPSSSISKANSAGRTTGILLREVSSIFVFAEVWAVGSKIYRRPLPLR